MRREFQFTMVIGPPLLVLLAAFAALAIVLASSQLFVTPTRAVEAEPTPTPMCAGVVATIVGTSGDDLLRGTAGDDVITGLGGNDTILAGPGNDTACGGPGVDRLFGHDGTDELHGGPGDDEAFGGAGVDDVFGEDGNDGLSGGPQNDRLFGGPGNDTMAGNEGSDTVRGGPDDDGLIGGAPGNDTLRGEAGNDTLSALDGAPGDTLTDNSTGRNRCLADATDRVSNGCVQPIRTEIKQKLLEIDKVEIEIEQLLKDLKDVCDNSIKMKSPTLAKDCEPYRDHADEVQKKHQEKFADWNQVTNKVSYDVVENADE
jgi:hypothetical protein